MRRLLIPILSLLLWPVLALAEISSPGADFFDFGYFCEVETIDQQVAEDTLSGVVNLVAEPPQFLRRSTLVPAQIGVGFGVHVTVKPELEGLVTIETLHPPMGPEGIARETWQSDLLADELSYNGFTFEYDYELVRGPWTISARANGREIYRVDFEVVDPRLLPPVICDGGLLS